MKEKKYSDEVKAEVLAAYQSKEKTATELEAQYNVPKQYIYVWASDAKKASKSAPSTGSRKAKVREAAKEVYSDDADASSELQAALDKEREEVQKISARINALLDVIVSMRS